MTTYDVVVLGLGAAGSSTVHALARAGASVLGIDAHRPPHSFGSSHGDTRLTRLAISEGDAYVPLVLRSHELWREIEAETGAELLVECGGLNVGPASGGVGNHGVADVFAATVRVAQKYGIAHELLDSDGLRERFPQFRLPGDHRGYYEHRAGFVRPEAAITAQLGLAERQGATLRYDEPVREIVPHRNGVTVRTSLGSYDAGSLVVAAGPWLPELLPVPSLAGLFSVQRQVLHWFRPADPAPFQPGRFPVFFLNLGEQDPPFVYGFPAIDGQVKVATERYAGPTSPRSVDRTVHPSEPRAIHERALRTRLPGLPSRAERSTVCLYTVTPDFGFVVDRLPEMPQVWVTSPCSGHGFKHSAALGEALAEQVLTGRSHRDLSAFGLERFSGRTSLPSAPPPAPPSAGRPEPAVGGMCSNRSRDNARRPGARRST